jgi:predicted HAD superfamily Cof-like phosphohydrolase
MNKKQIKKYIEDRTLSSPISDYENSIDQKNQFSCLDCDKLIRNIDVFHKKFGFEKNEKVGIPDDNELVNFRTSFLMEELAEYTNAITKKDAAGALDALVDIVYIALGTAWLFNLPFEKAWKEVQKANMSKIRAKSKSKKRGTTFDVVKPKNWKAPNIERIIEEEIEINENFSNRI